MWNKVKTRFTLRIKITLLTAIALTVIAAGITGLSIYNARQITFIPRGELVPLVNTYIRPFAHQDVMREAGIHFVMPRDAVRDLSEMIPYARVNSFFSPAHIISDGYSIQLSGQDALAALIQSQQDFQTYSIAIAVGAVLLGTIAAYIISGQTLKPIKTLAGKIEDIDANNLSQPLQSPKTTDEVSRLTHSFNNMLGKLNRSFEAKKLFAQNAAHELKTPLASIRANIEVLQMDAEPSVKEYKEVVDIVKDSTEGLISLTERLLSLNSIDGEITWQSFDGKAVFERIVYALREDIIRLNLNVSIEGECRLRGDKALLERAFFNLVHNAIRYNVDGGSVKARLEESSIIIEDSGVGIPREHMQHLFEPFYCVDKSRSKKLGGHGLGMTIAKSIFDKHDIEIFIFSEPGSGTRVFLSM